MFLFSCRMVLAVSIALKRNDVYCDLDLSYHEEKVNYNVAFETCKREGMIPLVIDSESASKDVNNILTDTRTWAEPEIWLGLTLPQSSSNPADYIWSNNRPLSWTRWGKTFHSGSFLMDPEPNNLDKHKCVIIINNWMWRSRSCLDAYSFVCQPHAVSQTDVSQPQPLSLSGSYFVKLKDMIPSGEAFSEFQVGSSTQCASSCLLREQCDVIVWKSPGICQLFSNLTSLERGNSLHAASRMYQRKRMTAYPVPPVK